MWKVEVMTNEYTDSNLTKVFKTEKEARKYERKINRMPVSFHSVLAFEIRTCHNCAYHSPATNDTFSYCMRDGSHTFIACDKFKERK